MSIKADIEIGWTRLPADCAPIAGAAVQRLFDVDGPGFLTNLGIELMQDGWIERDPPDWIEDRLADWWLRYEPDDLCVPLAWFNDELMATMVCWREREHRTNGRKREL